jgi:hypothetical protein
MAGRFPYCFIPKFKTRMCTAVVTKTCQGILINSNILLKMSAGGLFLFFRRILYMENKG